MILDEFLSVAQFGDSSITVPQDKARVYFRFLREALLDGHIPVHKVIGFVTIYVGLRHNKGGRKPVEDYHARFVNREWRMNGAISAARDLALGECNFDMNERFLHILLKPTEYPIIYTSTDHNGPVPTEELQYPFNQAADGTYNFTNRIVKGETGKWITENDYYSPEYGPWFTFLGNNGEFQLYLYLIESTGYRDANELHNYLPKKHELNNIVREWVPFDQNFNMSEFIKVKPLLTQSNKIQLLLKYGMSVDFLKERLTNWKNKVVNNSLDTKEIEWLRQYN